MFLSWWPIGKENSYSFDLLNRNITDIICRLFQSKTKTSHFILLAPIGVLPLKANKAEASASLNQDRSHVLTILLFFNQNPNIIRTLDCEVSLQSSNTLPDIHSQFIHFWSYTKPNAKLVNHTTSTGILVCILKRHLSFASP